MSHADAFFAPATSTNCTESLPHVRHARCISSALPLEKIQSSGQEEESVSPIDPIGDDLVKSKRNEGQLTGYRRN
jgi:hypothetical protein